MEIGSRDKAIRRMSTHATEIGEVAAIQVSGEVKIALIVARAFASQNLTQNAAGSNNDNSTFTASACPVKCAIAKGCREDDPDHRA